MAKFLCSRCPAEQEAKPGVDIIPYHVCTYGAADSWALYDRYQPDTEKDNE